MAQDGAGAERALTLARPDRERAHKNRLKSWTSAVLVLFALACIAVTLPGPWLLAATIGVGFSITWRRGVDRRELVTMLLGMSVGATAIDYLVWRFEVSNWAGWEIAAPLLAAEVFGALHVLGLQHTVWPAPRPLYVRETDPTTRCIFILIPTVDEGPDVLTSTIQGAVETRRRYLAAFPHARVVIAVCSDARVAGFENWAEIEDLARRLGVTCITRKVGGGNKAGNLENARRELRATGDALVAIFDADQIAQPDFLLKTVPPFADPSVGWVQTGQYYRNLDQPVARWANDQQALFYRGLCPGKAVHNAAFICGTNVVIRADALDQIGGLPQDSVTEDFAASIKLHPKWRSVYLTEVLALGLGPMDLPGFLKQQRRWAIGTMTVLRTHWRAILLPQRGGLQLEQRIQYALACTHYLSGVRDFIFVLSPIAFLVTGIPAVRTASLGLFLWHFLPYWVASQAAFWHVGRRQTGLRGIILGFGSFPVLLEALVTVVAGRRAAFGVTSKRRRSRRSWSHLAVYGMTLLCCFIAIGLALFDRRLRPESMAISILWVAYDVSLLAAFLWLALSDIRFKESLTRKGRQPIGPSRRPTYKLPRLSRTPGAVLVVVLLATAYLLASASAPEQVVLAASRPPGQPPYLGLTLPYQLLGSPAVELEDRLCLPFTVIGRTQDTSDSFDLAWANELAARAQRPWITLQFGNFSSDGKPPLNASLPAIANGLRDADLRRWARDIHRFGKPVYLTILLHVDRNWSVSSAVANGGIPQDVPRAWEHVQAVFRSAGDTNVAWVWAPADPANDQEYSPPEPAIDIVLQSMIRYPDTAWPDPEAVLSAVSARHPGKPLFLEVSGSGPPDEKAAWLGSVATKVVADPQVYALMYHEGAPDVHATAEANASWALESDPSSLQAVRSWQSLVPTVDLPCQTSPQNKLRSPTRS